MGEPSFGMLSRPSSLSPSVLELLEEDREEEDDDDVCEPERLELGIDGIPPGFEAVAPGSDGLDDELPGEPLEGDDELELDDELLDGIDGIEELELDELALGIEGDELELDELEEEGDDEDEEDDDGIEGEELLLDELCCCSRQPIKAMLIASARARGTTGSERRPGSVGRALRMGLLSICPPSVLQFGRGSCLVGTETMEFRFAFLGLFRASPKPDLTYYALISAGSGQLSLLQLRCQALNPD